MDWSFLSEFWYIIKLAGIAVGAIAGGLTGMVLGPWIGGPKVKRVITLGGSALGGFVVWLVLNHVGGTGGGWGLFGGGSGSGSKYGVSTKPGPTAKTSAQGSRDPKIDYLRIMMLGGMRVHDQRFYVVEAEPPRNWNELIATIAERQTTAPVKGIEIVIYRDSVDKDTPAVQQLVAWAKENKIKVAMSFPAEDAPEKPPDSITSSLTAKEP